MTSSPITTTGANSAASRLAAWLDLVMNARLHPGFVTSHHGIWRGLGSMILVRTLAAAGFVTGRIMPVANNDGFLSASKCRSVLHQPSQLSDHMSMERSGRAVLPK